METILQDLAELEPFHVILPPCPYNINDSISRKTRRVKEHIARTKYLKQRHKQLYYYYCLGQLLEDVDLTKAQRLEIKHQVTSYQYVVAIRIYRIFEHSVDQIFRTRSCRLKSFHQLTADEVTSLCAFNENIFNGAENLEAEN